MTERERDKAQMFKEKKEKCLCSCLSDDTDYTVVILDWSFHCKGIKIQEQCGNESTGQNKN